MDRRPNGWRADGAAHALGAGAWDRYARTSLDGGHASCRIRLGGAGPMYERCQDYSAGPGSIQILPITPGETEEGS